MTLKILQLVPESLPSFRADVATLFGKYLPRHGIVCDVVGMPSIEPAAPQGFASARRPPYHASRLRREAAYAWLCLRALVGARWGSCAAVQVRDMVSIGLLALLVARAKGLPFYYWVSYLMSEGRIERAEVQLARRRTLRNYAVLWKGKLERALLYRLVLPAADHVFVQSDRMAEVIAGAGIAPARLTAVPMGVDMELLQAQTPQPRRLAGWDGVPLIAYLGTVERPRQLERVIDALALVREHHPAARLLLIGNSPNRSDETALLDHARARGLVDAVHITGWLPAAQAWSLLSAADAAVSYIPRGALYDVSSPTKLLEYLALGMPAVGNDTPDQAYVLSKSSAGWLTDSTPAAMGRALCTILDNPAAARIRAAAGPAFIESERSYRELAAMLAHRYKALLGT